MSRRNKVNPDHYTIAGRLTPDDLARERRKQAEPLFGATRGRRQKPMAPWMANDATNDTTPKREAENVGAGGGDQEEQVEVAEAVPIEEGDFDEVAQQPQAKPRSGAKGKQQAIGGDKEKPVRRTREARKQTTRTGTTRGARSAQAKGRSKPKASGARGTPTGGKAPRARGSAARKASPQRAGRPKAHAKKTKSAATTKSASTGRRAKKAKKAKKR